MSSAAAATEAVKAQGAAQAAQALAVGAAQAAAVLAVPRDFAEVRHGDVNAGEHSGSQGVSLADEPEDAFFEGQTILAGALVVDEATILPEAGDSDLTATILRSPTPPSLGSLLTWEVEKHMHPMITESEKQCIWDCLQELDNTILQEEGLALMAAPDNACRKALLGKAWRPEMGEEELLRMLLEAVLKQRARTGSEGIFVEPGFVLSLGSKKILKLSLWCGEATAMRVSICWDWDVKLERLPATES